MVIAKFLRITIPAPAYHREGFEVFAEGPANLVFLLDCRCRGRTILRPHREGPAKREDCEPGTCSIIRLK